MTRKGSFPVRDNRVFNEPFARYVSLLIPLTPLTRYAALRFATLCLKARSLTLLNPVWDSEILKHVDAVNTFNGNTRFSSSQETRPKNIKDKAGYMHLAPIVWGWVIN